MKQIQRVISLLLALVLTLGTVPPMAVRAEETEPTQAVTEAVAETTVPTETATEPVEETTVPTEAVSDPVEETTEAVTEPEVETTEETVPVTVEDDISVGAVNAAVTSGQCGANATWELDASGTLTISGTGYLSNQTSAPWYSVKDSIVKVVIGEGIIDIPNYAFNSCKNLTEVSIPDTVTKLGYLAFGSCVSLRELYIPKSVVTITMGTSYSSSLVYGCSEDLVIYCAAPSLPEQWEYGWDICNSSRQRVDVVFGSVSGEREYWNTLDTSGSTVTIREGITSIPSGAFSGLTNLTEVVIPSSVIQIADEAFSGCTNLVYAHLPDKLTWIGHYAFYNCSSLISAMMPDTVEYLGNYAFNYCTNLSGLRLSSAIPEIGMRAFYECPNLTRVTLPESLISIGEEAFSGCSGLVSVAFPDGLSSIGEYAFSGCKELKTVAIPDGVTVISKGAFANCSGLTEVTLPSGITSIGARAFDYCASLKSINLNLPGLTEIGEYAFYKCESLERIDLPDSLTTIGNDVFVACKGLKTVTLGDGITTLGYRMFWQCSSLESISLPDGITVIPVNAFGNCTSLSRLKLPANLTEICSNAFSSCEKLTSVTLPNSLKTLGADVFWGTAITSIHIPASVDLIWGNPFAHCAALKNITVASGNGVFEVRDGVLFTAGGKMLITYPLAREAAEYSVPEGVETIGNNAFDGCTNLTKITFPDTVTAIGDSAFSGVSLLEMELPVGLRTMGDYAFFNSMLESVVIPPALEEISFGAFMQSRLESVVIPEGVKIIGVDAFSGNGFLKTAVLSESVTTIDERAFNWCNNLETLILPETLENINYRAFSACNSLKKIYFTGTQEQWEEIYISSGNDPLYNAEIQYNSGGVIPQSGTCGDNLIWELDSRGTLTVSGTGEMKDFLLPSGAPWYPYRMDIRKLIIGSGITQIGINAFNGYPYLARVTIPDTMETIALNAFASCKALAAVVYDGTYTGWDDIRIWPGNTALENAKLLIGKIVDYVDNNAIRINGSGSAYAYYLWAENSSIWYELNGDERKAESNENGIIRIPLGTFDTPGKYPLTISVTHMAEEPLDEPILLQPVVYVTELSYSQKWKLSMDAKVGAELLFGEAAQLGPLGVAGELGSVGAKVGRGSIVTITDEHDDGSETLELTGEQSLLGEAEVKLGPSFEACTAEYKIAELGAGIEGNVAGLYGIKIKDYTEDDLDQNVAAGTFLLGEALASYPGALLFRELYRYVVKDIYDQDDITTIRGGSVGLKGSLGIDLNKFKIDDEALFTFAGAKGEVAVSSGKSRYTNGDRFVTSSYQTEYDLSFMVPEYMDSKIGPGIGRNFMGKDTTVKARIGGGAPELEATSLSAEEDGITAFLMGKHYKLDYDVYTFRDASLKELEYASEDVRDLMKGKKDLLCANDLAQIAEVIAESQTPIPYSAKSADQMVQSYEEDFSVKLAMAGATLEMALSYFQETEFSSRNGFAVDNQLYTISESNDLSETVEGDAKDLMEFIGTAFGALGEQAVGFFKEVGATLGDVIDGFFYKVESAGETLYDWTVSVISPSDTEESTSYQISATKTSNTARNVGSSAFDFSEATGNELIKAATIGKPILVKVTENATGQEINDISAAPLKLTMRYTAEELETAGLSTSSSVYLNGQIGLYRLSDEGQFFEFVSRENDLESMSVSAIITRTGQYVLAADACAPKLTSLETSDFGQTPTIVALIDDLSGLDLSKFRFALDGEEIITGTNASAYFNSLTGIFTYKVQEPLSEGKHTVSFTLADTTGNTETYDYILTVDVTAPVLEDVSVTGATNAGAKVEIRARVSDENIDNVYAVFSKQLEDGTWSDQVRTAMCDMGDGLWGLDYEGDGSSVRIRVIACDIAQNITESVSFDVYPFAESVTLSQEYIALKAGQKQQLTAEVQPAELAKSIQWSVESNKDSVITVDQNGVVTAKGAGTDYVIATVVDGEKAISARCRVDVAEPIRIEGIQLSTTNVTSELYSSDYAQFDILLQLPQNVSIMSLEDRVIPESMSVAIDEARFTDSGAKAAFHLVPLDDRRIAMVPTDEALKNPGGLAKSYKSKVTVVVDGRGYTTAEEMTVTLKQSLPKLKATVPAFNGFYTGQTQKITVTGGTLTGISGKEIPEWLTLNQDGTLALNEKAGTKNSGKAVLLVDTKEWIIPAEVTLSVKNTYKVPGLKLSASSVKMAANAADSSGIALKLLPRSKKDTLSGLNVQGIAVADGYNYSVAKFDPETGEFILKAENGFRAGSIVLNVSFSDTREILPLKLKVATQTVSLKLAPATVTLNKHIGDRAQIKVTAAPADYKLTALDVKGNEAGELDISYENGILTVGTNAQTKSQTYTLSVSAGNSKPVTLKVKITKDLPTVALKAKSAIDLSFPERTVSVVPTFRNYAGGEIADYTVKVIAPDGTATDAFKVSYEDGAFLVECRDTDAAAGTYQLHLTLELNNNVTLAADTKLTVKRTAVKLKLTPGRLTLNKKLDDQASVDVICTTKGYDFSEQPIWELKAQNKKDSAEGKLDIQWNDGRLQIAVNGATEAGATYNLQVKVNKHAPAVNLAIKIVDVNPTVSLKASGTIDVIREGTSILVTPAYRNCMELSKSETLKVYSSADNFTNPVDGLFSIDRDDLGRFVLTAAPGLDHTKTYKVELESTVSGVTVKSPKVSVKVKMGSAKLTLTADGNTMFGNDCNDRIAFRMTGKDHTLNGVKKVVSRDARFEIVESGNGEFALAFAQNTVDRSLLGKTVTVSLDVFLEGNETVSAVKPKANATLKLKVSIVK